MSLTGISLLSLGVKAVGSDGFKKLMKEAFDAIGSAGKIFLSRRGIEKTLGKIYTDWARVRMVKTLWQIDQPVDLLSFYCPSHVLIGDNRVLIDTYGDLESLGNVLIEGIAGQGKSIFLRYLCGTELVRAKRLPLFVELRRIRASDSLIDLVLTVGRETGLPMTRELFADLAATGKLMLMLDALDEVGDDQKSRIITEIEHLAKLHTPLPILVTSRPRNGLEVSPHFKVVRLSDLQGNEYKSVVAKLLPDHKLASHLLNQISEHHGDVQQLLKTPLLVTLLVINYKSYQQIPRQLSEFYDSLFSLLLQRHDGTKPGFTRPRLCAINDMEYRRAFEQFCFLSELPSSSTFDESVVYDFAERALKAESLSADPEKFVKDLVKITCLLVKDGEEYRFIHKSVQEYYCACAIRRKSEPAAAKIYNRLFDDLKQTWHQELRFLAEIDEYRHAKFGVIPAICKWLNLTIDQIKSGNGESAKTIVTNKVMASNLFLFANSSTGYFLVDDWIPSCEAAFFASLKKMDFGPLVEAAEDQSWLDDNGDGQLPFKKAYDAGFLVNDLPKFTEHLISQLIKKGQSAIRFVEDKDRDDSSAGFF